MRAPSRLADGPQTLGPPAPAWGFALLGPLVASGRWQVFVSALNEPTRWIESLIPVALSLTRLGAR
jgi:hypothetical protein